MTWRREQPAKHEKAKRETFNEVTRGIRTANFASDRVFSGGVNSVPSEAVQLRIFLGASPLLLPSLDEAR